MPVSGEAEVRAAVRRAWREVMRGAELDEALTWQEAGVDSLKSLQLLLMVEDALARPISFDLFTRETRIQDLIAILSGSRDGGAPGPARRRAYLVPGAYGDEPRLAELRASLRDDVAFETLQLPDLADPIEVSADLAATADFLARQVPEGSDGDPMILAGFSFGAHAAVATALALQARGAAPGLLCLFDPLAGLLPDPPKAWSQRGKVAFSASGACTALVKLLVWLGRIGAARRLALASASMRDVDGAQKRRRHVLHRLRAMAAGAWRPQAFQGRTILFATDDFERAGDPRRYLDLLPGVAIVRVGGAHLQMFEGEALHRIVATLRAVLAEPSAYEPASIASSASRSGL